MAAIIHQAAAWGPAAATRGTNKRIMIGFQLTRRSVAPPVARRRCNRQRGLSERPSAMEATQDRWRETGQIFCDQPRPMQFRRLGMDPGGRAGGLEAFHALSDKSADEARKDIAGPGRRQPWRTVGVHRRAPVGRCDHRIGPLEKHDGVRQAGGRASRGDPFGTGAQKPRKNALELTRVRGSARRRGRAPRTVPRGHGERRSRRPRRPPAPHRSAPGPIR